MARQTEIRRGEWRGEVAWLGFCTEGAREGVGRKERDNGSILCTRPVPRTNPWLQANERGQYTDSCIDELVLR